MLPPLTRPAPAEMKHKTRKLQTLLAALGGNRQGHRNLWKCPRRPQVVTLQPGGGVGAGRRASYLCLIRLLSLRDVFKNIKCEWQQRGQLFTVPFVC